MKNNYFRTFKSAAFLLILSVLISCKTEVPAEKPNIILIMTDDLGWYDVGFNGNTEVKTPNLDALAKQGIIFDRFYSASPVCSPTRASVMTGRHPRRTNINNANNGHLRNDEITIAEILKKQGYATAHFGKWHLGTLTKQVKDANRGGNPKFDADFTIPTMHGYDSFFCTESKVPTFDPLLKPAAFNDGESLRYGWKAITDNESKPYGTAYWVGNEVAETENLKGDNSRIIMDRVLPFMEQSSKNESPFFSTIWLHTPHLPVVADSLHRNMYSDLPLDKQLYYGTITAMDEQIGRLWNKVKALGQENNTILMFCSDNGPENGTPGSALHFRERKRSLYEGGIRVPAFALWKGKIKAGKRTDFPAVTSDYLPTIERLLELPENSDRPMDGVSLVDAMRKKETVRQKPIGFLYINRVSWVNHQYKLISTDKGKTFELYDLLADPSEKNNIIEQHQDIYKEMKAELDAWRASLENSNAGNDYK